MSVLLMIVNLLIQVWCVLFVVVLFRRWSVPFGWFLFWIMVVLLLIVTRRASSLTEVLDGHAHDLLNHLWLPLGITCALSAALVAFNRGIQRWIKQDPATRAWLLREVNRGIFDARQCDRQLEELRHLRRCMESNEDG